MKRKYSSMLSGPLLPGIISYTIPIMLTSLLSLFFNAADLVVVGRFCGSNAIGAIGATGTLSGLLVFFISGLSMGSGVAASHAIGSKNPQEVHRTVHTAIPLSILCGFLLLIVGVIGAKPLLRLMDTPETLLSNAALYMQIIFCGKPLDMVYAFSASILLAAGDPKGPLFYLSISGVLNVILNVFFVTVFHMNVAGVALATVISKIPSTVLVVLALMRREDACRLDLKKMRIYKPQLMKIIRIGVPAGAQNMLFSLSNVFIQSSINSFGDAVVSGNSAASNIGNFINCSFNAFQQTAINYIGQNTGAKQYRRVGQSYWACLGCASVLAILLGAVVYSFGKPLLSIYITDSPEAIEYGMIRLQYICLPYFLGALMEVTTGALRGLGRSTEPMVITVGGACGLRLLWIATVFQWVHTLPCLYLSYPVTWLITFLCELAVFLHIYRKNSTVYKPPPPCELLRQRGIYYENQVSLYAARPAAVGHHHLYHTHYSYQCTAAAF